MVVTCSTDKEYEIQSWNEQGEITKIEGILTIAFCFIFPCSHIDRRKELYLIIKIPYMVDMSLTVDNNTISNEDVRKLILKKDLSDDDKILLFKWVTQGYEFSSEWDDFQPHIKSLFDEYKENKNKIKELEEKLEAIDVANHILRQDLEKLQSKFDKISKEHKSQKYIIKKLKLENQRLKELTGEVDGEWKFEKNLMYRNHPITNEFEQYRIPYEFDYSAVSNPKFYFKEDEKFIKFSYWTGYTHDAYDMSCSAYEYLRKRYFEQQKEKPKEEIVQKINDIDEMKKHIENYGYLHYNFRKLDNVFNFFMEYKECTDKTFQRKYFTGKCKISPRTVSKYLEMLEKCELIIKLSSKGKYKVNIK